MIEPTCRIELSRDLDAEQMKKRKYGMRYETSKSGPFVVSQWTRSRLNCSYDVPLCSPSKVEANSEKLITVSRCASGGAVQVRGDRQFHVLGRLQPGTASSLAFVA